MNTELQKLSDWSNIHRKSVVIATHKETAGIEECARYSKHYIDILCQIYETIIPDHPQAQIALAVYGSASREEMSCESDADCIILSLKEDQAVVNFRRDFLDALSLFRYSKIDLLDCGEIEMLRIYARKSIVEGNQVLEAIPIVGDKEVIQRFVNMQEHELTMERSLRNLIFQIYSFRDYYSKRTKPGYVNIKYSEGGTRDILFYIWIARLIKITKGHSPLSIKTISDALLCLSSNNCITSEEEAQLLKACSHIMLLRSEALRINIDTTLSGLSFLKIYRGDPVGQSKLLKSVFSSNKGVIDCYNNSSYIISTIKHSLVDKVFETILSSYDYMFLQHIRKGDFNDQAIVSALHSPNIVIQIALIWELGDRRKLNIIKRHISQLIHENISCWEILASLASQPQLSASHLKEISNIALRTKEFGYILRIIAKHTNTNRPNLIKISRAALDKRYTELATISLDQGLQATHHQI